MAELLFDIARPTLPVTGSSARFPVRRIWCVGSNYKKPGRDYSVREEPYFFSKQPDMAVPDRNEIPHGNAGELRFEVELVVAIGKGGSAVSEANAPKLIFGHATGLDMTRRDLLLPAQGSGKPWEIGKSFDASAPVGAITPSDGLLADARIQLWQNGQIRQDSNTGRMIWTVPEILARLSSLVPLHPGDLIFTGTPSGHGPCLPGDVIEARVEGLAAIRASVTGPANSSTISHNISYTKFGS